MNTEDEEIEFQIPGPRKLLRAILDQKHPLDQRKVWAALFVLSLQMPEPETEAMSDAFMNALDIPLQAKDLRITLRGRGPAGVRQWLEARCQIA